jgi:hypothetical protein
MVESYCTHKIGHSIVIACPDIRETLVNFQIKLVTFRVNWLNSVNRSSLDEMDFSDIFPVILMHFLTLGSFLQPAINRGPL